MQNDFDIHTVWNRVSHVSHHLPSRVRVIAKRQSTTTFSFLGLPTVVGTPGAQTLPQGPGHPKRSSLEDSTENNNSKATSY